MKHLKGKKLNLNKLTITELGNEFSGRVIGGVDTLPSECNPTLCLTCKFTCLCPPVKTYNC